MEQMTTKIETRDADWAMLEKRLEEVAQTVKDLETQLRKIADGTTEDGSGSGQKSSHGNVMRNPALRNLDSYTGDHKKICKMEVEITWSSPWGERAF